MIKVISLKLTKQLMPYLMI